MGSRDLHVSSVVHEDVSNSKGEEQTSVKVIKRTLGIHEIEAWRRDNPAILTGWRREMKEWKEVRETLWEWHNETVNIWSHIIGSLLGLVTLLACLHVSLSPQLPFESASSTPSLSLSFIQSLLHPPIPLPSLQLSSVTWIDTSVFTLLYAGSAICFAASAFFHLSLCHQQDVVDLTRKVDFLGIFILGNANFIPTFQYGFFCEPGLRNTYIAMMTLSLGSYIVVLSPSFQTAEYRRLRTATFLIVGWMALIPFIHSTWLHGWSEVKQTMALRWIAVEVLAYVGGAAIYAERFPERFAPGVFDHVGASHQIFHVLAVVGVMAQAAAARQGFEVWHVAREGVCVA
ncbi:HlyIII-domain-containing protein [Meredithblackwellia eburnea MCA 4105]